MKYYYFEESDSLFIPLRDGEYDESEEIYDGFVIKFYDRVRNGRLAIDIDHASKFVDIPRLLRSMAPRALRGRATARARMVTLDAPLAEKP